MTRCICCGLEWPADFAPRCDCRLRTAVVADQAIVTCETHPDRDVVLQYTIDPANHPSKFPQP